jgi:AraC-like DNA-binding protein
MEFAHITPLKGNIILTDAFHLNASLLNDKNLYKFLWVTEGRVSLEIDYVWITLEKNEVIPLSSLHHIVFKEVDGKYLTLLFNSNFYCIFKSDDDVSCNGFLFTGTSNIMKLRLSDMYSSLLEKITSDLYQEYNNEDSLQEEMLRLHLKRFIITCTRIAREKFAIEPRNENTFYIIRQYFTLVDKYFREKKQVKDYANMLHRSPKTLTNLFQLYNLPSPLHIIHERIEAEAKRLLLYSSKTVKEISGILGFEDIATFSRFFKRSTGENISQFRSRVLFNRSSQ